MLIFRFIHDYLLIIIKMISGVFEEAVPQTIEEKKAFMLKHNIAMWDTI